MTTKNIVNIQNNKLDFYVNGTNKFNVSLRGTDILEVNELGRIIAKQTTAETTNPKAATTFDFEGYISHIDNHSIGNLSDVLITSASPDQLLQYNGASWINRNVTDIVPSGVLTINNGESDQNITIGTDTFNIIGNPNTIEVTLLTGVAKGVSLTLQDDVEIVSSLSVGTNPGFFTVQDGTNGFEIKGSGAGSYALNQNSGGQTTLNSASATPVIISNGGSAALIVDTDVTISNNLIVTGDLTVNGTNTIINTEVKLIEDSVIELNYTPGNYNKDYDVGFAGRYTNLNVCGFCYDTSAGHFKVFDSMLYTDFNSTAPNIIDKTKVSFADLFAKDFEAQVGQIGSSVDTILNATSSLDISVSTKLQTYYGATNFGIYCGKLVASSYSNQYSSSAVTTLNYTLTLNSGGSVFIATVDIETKSGTHNYLSYNDSTQEISYVVPSDVATHTPEILIRILPITAIHI